MKVLILLSLFILVSCGKIVLPEDTKLGTLKSLKPQAISVGSSEYFKIKEICDAVKTKSVTINSLINTDYIFAGTSKSCADTSFSNIADAEVKLVNQLDLYKFVQGPNLFYFSDVETEDQGVLGTICSDIQNLVSPIVDGTNLLYFTATDIVSSDCLNSPDEKCLKIERAIKVDAENGRVHTREWLKTRINQTKSRIGFVSYRKRISEAGCEDGALFGRTATLK
jgi:hypothetical protein